MEKRPQKRKVKTALLVAVLAVACIGGVELLACRHYAPELYSQITRPVAEAAAAVSSFFDGTKDFFAGLMERAKPEEPEEPEPEDLPEDQLASEPTLELDYLKAAADPSVTQLTTRNGVEVLTGGGLEFVYYNQGDPQWAEQPYGTDLIGGYGCGPTAMAMVVSSMTDQKMDPAEMAQWAVENGYWAKKRGSSPAIVEGAAQAFGLKVRSVSLGSPEELHLELATGSILVALMAPGHFTQSGHFIILRGVALDGSILVADPNSDERSVTTWDAQIILDELSRNRRSGAPVWSITRIGLE